MPLFSSLNIVLHFNIITSCLIIAIIDLKKFDLGEMGGSSGRCVQKVTSLSDTEANVTFTDGQTFNVNRGVKELESSDAHYINTDHQDRLIADLLTSHRYHDLCIVGPRVGTCV